MTWIVRLWVLATFVGIALLDRAYDEGWAVAPAVALALGAFVQGARSQNRKSRRGDA